MDWSDWAIRKTFPGVQQVPCSQLVAALADATQRIILLDVREPAEFAMSHIVGAQNIAPAAHSDVEKLIQALPSLRERAEGADDGRVVKVVCYCSIGYRSSQLAYAIGEHLPHLAGRVYNLEGSIFRWANSGHAVVDAVGKPANKVHRYSALWGQLLNAELRGS